MDRTVSRRSEPSSRTALMGEQPNPWNILQPQVAKSRHRGAKPSRRCRLSSLLDGWVLQSSSLLPLHSRANLRLARGNLCTPPLPLGRPTPHRNCLPETVPRPCPDRYAFRAGRNLPDKEFRYLRTVIVTAAVHRGFGVSPHTWSYDFAETCVFGKQSPGPGHCDPLCEEAPLLPKLRGYFAEFLRESCLAPLGILYLPTCVGFGLAFATAPVVSLNQATAYESPAHSSTGTRSESRAEPPPTAWELTVSCSISLPDGGSFHPSLTVLLHYRSPRSI
ncbi:hypothetical protein VNO80_32932 [Phaseolus coccineus]|uniref:Uncharacterized protein n=1 Tax=Phaseolus coccineus TaxID=3886 RepID=A0AAN9KZ56_PHACN